MELHCNLGEEVARLADDLREVYKGAVPFAVREAVNKTAFEGRAEWQKKAGEAFTLRNTWTTRSMRVQQASRSEKNIDRIEATLGSALPYMAERESGGRKVKKGKHGVLIPTPVASGQPRDAQRTKPVQRRNMMTAMQLHRRVTGSRQRKNMVSILQALKGSRVAFLQLDGGRKGFFRVKGNAKKWDLDMIWDMSHDSVRTGPMPTLEPASEQAGKHLPRYLVGAMEAQLARQIARRL